jgi:hypothetical protein
MIWDWHEEVGIVDYPMSREYKEIKEIALGLSRQIEKKLEDLIAFSVICHDLLNPLRDLELEVTSTVAQLNFQRDFARQGAPMVCQATQQVRVGAEFKGDIK